MKLIKVSVLQPFLMMKENGGYKILLPQEQEETTTTIAPRYSGKRRVFPRDQINAFYEFLRNFFYITPTPVTVQLSLKRSKLAFADPTID